MNESVADAIARLPQTAREFARKLELPPGDSRALFDALADRVDALTRELEEAKKAMAPFAHFDREWRGWHARQVAAGCAHDGDTLYRFYVYDTEGDGDKQELAVLTMDDFAVLAQVVARLSSVVRGEDDTQP